MKYSIKTILFLPILLFLTCNSAKKNLQTNKPLLINNAESNQISTVTYQKWVAGQQQSGSGYNLTINTSKQIQTLQLKDIYFRGLKGKITKTGNSYKATLKQPVKKDIQLSSDVLDEHKNSLPEASNFPFLLNDNECVISYIDSHTIKFIKIINLKEKPAEYYPSAKPRK